MLKVKKLLSEFEHVDFQHIYIEQNGEANDLSKQALELIEGRLFVT